MGRCWLTGAVETPFDVTRFFLEASFDQNPSAPVLLLMQTSMLVLMLILVCKSRILTANPTNYLLPVVQGAGPHGIITSYYVSYRLNSLKGGYMGDYIGDYYRGC